MRRFYICLMTACMISAATSAQSNLRGRSTVDEILKAVQSSAKVEKTDFTRAGKAVYKLRPATRENALRKADALPDTLIKATPEGKLHAGMYGESHAWYRAGLALHQRTSDGFAVDLVEGSDGALYIKNPFSTALTNSWIKGEKATGDTIVVKLPQLVVDETDQYGTKKKYYAQRIWMKIDDQGYADYGVQEDDNEIKFVWRNDTLQRAGKEILGMTDETGTWLGYGDNSTVISTVKEPLAVPAHPENAQKMAMTFKRYDDSDATIIARGVEENGYLYIGGIYDGNDFWIKGKEEDGKVTFLKQYVGVDPAAGYHCYFVPTHVDSVYYPEYNYTERTYTMQDNIVFDRNEDTGALTTDSVFIVNCGRSTVSTYVVYSHAALKPWEDKAYTPKDPQITHYVAYDPEYGFGGAQIIIEARDENGEIIDPNQLYYRIYKDDELYTLTPDLYPALKENMTDIPYSLHIDYYIHAFDKYHVFYFFTDFPKIGVQCVYKGGGQESVSNLITLTHAATGIDSVSTDDAAGVESVTFTDLGGRKVEAPHNGLYLKTVTYRDGKVKTTKVVVK